MEVLGLDFTTAVISTVVFVLLAVLLYIFSIFGVREKTYEEALEEQRQRNEAYLFQSKSEKADKSGREKKFRKPWSKRAKERHQTDKGGSELSGNESTGPEHVVFKPETEVIPSDFDSSASKSVSKSKKNKKLSKPILLNKDEGSPKKEVKAPEADEEAEGTVKKRSNSFNLTKPRDEIELRHLQQAVIETAKQQSECSEVSDESQEVKDQGIKQRKKNSSKLEEKDIPNQESPHEVKKEVITPVQSSPVKKQKKAKVETVNLSGDSVSASHLVNFLKNSILSDAEVQQLIDILLNRQQSGNSEWTRKGDPVAALKKQLQEKEQSLEDEQRLTQSANAKLKEIRAESTNDKTRFSQLERQLNLKTQTLQQEIQALHNRMCHSHEQQVAESSALQTQLQQTQSALNEDRISLQRITEENNRLREAESSNIQAMNHLQLELEKLRTSKEQCEIANNDLIYKIEQWNNTEANYKQEEVAMNQHISELTNQLNQIESNKQTMIQEISGLKSDSNVKDSKLSEVQEKLNQFEKISKDSETHFNDMKSKYNQKVNECESLQTDVKSFKSQMSEITNQYNTSIIEVDKLKAQNNSLNAQIESAKDSQQNGDMNNDGIKNIAIIEHDEIVQEKDKEITRLKVELAASLSKLKTHKADLDLQCKKNNELREKNWKIMDTIANNEKTATTNLNECKRAAGEKLAETISLEQKTFRKSLQKLFPVINLENITKFCDWLSEFEKEALYVINQYSEQKPENDQSEELLSLNDKVEKLENKNKSFKSSLIETETILQKLQKSVNESEKVWVKKLQEQEKELRKIEEEKQSLLSKLSQVQASQDMQTELKNLESKLQSEELERKSLAEKYNEANETSKQFQQKLEESEREMEVLKKEHGSIDELSKELDEIKSQLEKEHKTNKDLSADKARLQSLLKIGETSIKAEIERADKLQEELKQYQCEKSLQDTSSTQELKNSSSPIKENGSSKK